MMVNTTIENTKKEILIVMNQSQDKISLAMHELDKATNSNSASFVETAKYGQILQQQASGLNQAIEELAKVING